MHRRAGAHARKPDSDLRSCDLSSCALLTGCWSVARKGTPWLGVACGQDVGRPEVARTGLSGKRKESREAQHRSGTHPYMASTPITRFQAFVLTWLDSPGFEVGPRTRLKADVKRQESEVRSRTEQTWTQRPSERGFRRLRSSALVCGCSSIRSVGSCRFRFSLRRRIRGKRFAKPAGRARQERSRSGAWRLRLPP